MYILFAAITLAALGMGLGFLLGAASRYFKVEENPLVDEIERMMPGSQCGQCNYPGCRPAAEALVAGEAPPTLCPPGGKALAEQLANKLSIELDLAGMRDAVPLVARVDESICIGCARCTKVCPTDALVGVRQDLKTGDVVTIRVRPAVTVLPPDVRPSPGAVPSRCQRRAARAWR